MSPARWIVFNRSNDTSELVNCLRTVSDSPGSPLLSINRAKISILIGPLVPDRDTVVIQVFDIGITIQEPEQFVNDRTQVELLRGETWK